MNVQPQIRAKRRAHRRRQTHDRHHKRGTDHGAANKKRARGGGPVKIVSLGFTSDGDANGGANADATALPSSRPSNLPGSQWRWRDLPTTAPGLAEPERREPIPHQLQRGPELSSSSLIAPFGDRMPCQRKRPILISRSPQRRPKAGRERRQLLVSICAGVINAWLTDRFHRPRKI